MGRETALVRGYFGIGVVNGKVSQNVGTLLRSAYAFGAAFVFTTGTRYQRQCSDTSKAWRHMPLFHFPEVSDLLAYLPYDCRLVGIELDARARDLASAIHPERACYLLGAEDHGLEPDVLARCHEIFQVGGAARCLNVSVAGSIVLWDRQRKAIGTQESRP